MTATPVGDYIRRRWPDNPGATHWLGSEDGDPGCCGGSHPACLYGAAYREGERAERERWQVMMTAPVSCWCACGHSGHGPVHCVWAHEPPASRPRAHRIDDCPFADLLRGAG